MLGAKIAHESHTTADKMPLAWIVIIFELNSRVILQAFSSAIACSCTDGNQGIKDDITEKVHS